MYNETVHHEGPTEEKLLVPTFTEIPSQNSVIHTDTELKIGTNLESFGQALQTKYEMIIELASYLTEKEMNDM